MNDRREQLGVLPSADVACQRKRELAEATLDSTDALITALTQSKNVDSQVQGIASDVVSRLREALRQAQRPGTIVEPEYYHWYFKAVDRVQDRDLAGAGRALSALPAVAAVPLARIVSDEPASLQVWVDEDGSIELSGRVAHHLVAKAGTWITTTLERGTIRSNGHVLYEGAVTGKEKAGEMPLGQTAIILRQTGRARHAETKDYQANLSESLGGAFEFSVVPEASLAENGALAGVRSRLLAGLELIGLTWPELQREALTLTDSITLVDGYPFVGGSSITCYGATFFNLDPAWSDLAFADHIVHECAHQRLHAEVEVEPALANPQARSAASPIRPDPRPLEGILHATLVFLRLSLFLERVIDGADGVDGHDSLTRFHRHVLGFYGGMKVLTNEAVFTEKGQELFELMAEERSRLKTVLPVPDPTLYNAIACDYEKPSALPAATWD